MSLESKKEWKKRHLGNKYCRQKIKLLKPNPKIPKAAGSIQLDRI